MKSTRAMQVLGILKDGGHCLEPSSTLLDFGCGNGDLVMAFLEMGHDAAGCDLSFKQGEYLSQLRNRGALLKIPTDPYRLPFEDSTFDLVVSDQVLEHVADHEIVLSEIARVMKPQAVSLHFFPSRYSLVEVHRNIPLGALIQSRSWVDFWASLGVGHMQPGSESPRDCTEETWRYLQTNTNYLSKTKIRKLCKQHFGTVRFCEREFLKYSIAGGFLYQFGRVLPLIPWAVGIFRSHTLLLAEPSRLATDRQS